MKYSLTRVSRNKKTGPMPVVTSSKTTCPTSCSLKDGGGCYAEGGPLNIHWNNTTRAGVDFEELVTQIARLPRHQMWRYGQAGDLPGEGDSIDLQQLDQLATANRGRPVIAFTHKPATPQNLRGINVAKEKGFVINLSADNMTQADQLVKWGLPVVSVISHEYARNKRRDEWQETLSEFRSRIRHLPKHTPDGNRIAICPATYTDAQCIDCGVCSRDRGPVIVGFPAHGIRKLRIGK